MQFLTFYLLQEHCYATTLASLFFFPPYGHDCGRTNMYNQNTAWIFDMKDVYRPLICSHSSSLFPAKAAAAAALLLIFTWFSSVYTLSLNMSELNIIQIDIASQSRRHHEIRNCVDWRTLWFVPGPPLGVWRAIEECTFLFRLNWSSGGELAIRFPLGNQMERERGRWVLSRDQTTNAKRSVLSTFGTLRLLYLFVLLWPLTFFPNVSSVPFFITFYLCCFLWIPIPQELEMPICCAIKIQEARVMPCYCLLM